MGKRQTKSKTEKKKDELEKKDLPETPEVDGATTDEQDLPVGPKEESKKSTKKEKSDLPVIEDFLEAEVLIDGMGLRSEGKEDKIEKFHIKSERFPEGAIAVFQNGVFVRAYSEEKNGEDFEELAKGFAAKNTDEKKDKKVELFLLAEGGECRFVGQRKKFKKAK